MFFGGRQGAEPSFYWAGRQEQCRHSTSCAIQCLRTNCRAFDTPVRRCVRNWLRRCAAASVQGNSVFNASQPAPGAVAPSAAPLSRTCASAELARRGVGERRQCSLRDASIRPGHGITDRVTPSMRRVPRSVTHLRGSNTRSSSRCEDDAILARRAAAHRVPGKRIRSDRKLGSVPDRYSLGVFEATAARDARAQCRSGEESERPRSHRNVSKSAGNRGPVCLLTSLVSRGYLPESSFYEAGWLSWRRRRARCELSWARA
jgi:hypothetical protein